MSATNDEEQWDVFVADARRQAIQPIMESAAVIVLLPGSEVDVKVCLEIGAAVLLDKPILAIALPGRPVPVVLRRIATHVIEADPDTHEGRELIRLAVNDVLADVRKDVD